MKLSLIALAVSSFVISPSILAAAETKTLFNVILINADDLGFGDLSCYGAEKVNEGGCAGVRLGVRFSENANPKSRRTAWSGGDFFGGPGAAAFGPTRLRMIELTSGKPESCNSIFHTRNREIDAACDRCWLRQCRDATACRATTSIPCG